MSPFDGQLWIILWGTQSASSNPEKATLHTIPLRYFCVNLLSQVFHLRHCWWALSLHVAHILTRVYILWLGRK
jgi:hypothetical protein